jgi:hypothetical protein
VPVGVSLVTNKNAQLWQCHQTASETVKDPETKPSVHFIRRPSLYNYNRVQCTEKAHFIGDIVRRRRTRAKHEPWPPTDKLTGLKTSIQE